MGFKWVEIEVKMLLRIFFILLLALPLSAIASRPWIDVLNENSYSLEKSLRVKNTNVNFSRGSVIKVIERAPLNMIKVEMFKIRVVNCQYPEVTSNLELYEILQPNGTKTTIGVEVSKGCELEMFVELKDLNTNSFFD